MRVKLCPTSGCYPCTLHAVGFCPEPPEPFQQVQVRRGNSSTVTLTSERRLDIEPRRRLTDRRRS